MMEENIIEFKNVNFSYSDDTPLIENFSLNIKKGNYTVLLGHNGSGKSTIAQLIIGLLEAKSGSVFVDGIELKEENIDKIRSKVAIVFQNPDNQFIGSTVEDDIAFGLENKCIDPKDMLNIIKEYATKVNMIDYLKQEPSSLSGGQKQRVAIAGALALKPEILVLDEATSMLDPMGKKEIMDLILSLKKENPNMSILSITHHIDEALYADEIIVLNDGKVIKSGTPSQILYDGELLEKNNLVPPFVIQVQEKLASKGISIEKSFSIEDLVNKL